MANDSSRLAAFVAAALVVGALGSGCGSAPTGRASSDAPAPPDGGVPAIDVGNPEPRDVEARPDTGFTRTRVLAPTQEELASALYEARLYASAAWLYERVLEHTESDEALFRRAVSLLLSRPARAVGRAKSEAARADLARLVELFPESEHWPAAQSLLKVVEALESVEGKHATTQRQLDALREIDLEKPPR